ncbi:hypothetical protein Dda_6619 [Drechslerella dactyloides]|uniref:Transcription factor domain-containing protein n=1 Tax=Drechslerella dactyloides TaxID=74499 RepID=A0AAD6ITT9_DREDA|nr:hypothetical protein Dda_6619 [Drechslerella dactyloides]
MHGEKPRLRIRSGVREGPTPKSIFLGSCSSSYCSYASQNQGKSPRNIILIIMLNIQELTARLLLLTLSRRLAAQDHEARQAAQAATSSSTQDSKNPVSDAGSSLQKSSDSCLSYSSTDFQREASLLSSKTVESWTRIRPFMEWNPDSTIAQDIENLFRQEFEREYPPAGDNPYLRVISTFVDKMKDIDESSVPATLQNRELSDKNSPSSVSSPNSEAMEVQYRAPVMSYDGVLTFMAQEVVEMVAIMYGRLGCQHLEDSAGKFYVKSCLGDPTTSMFSKSILNGTAAQKPSPLARFEQHQIVQMVESWFSLHPLSGIASKTLFLRQFRDGKHDEILLNLMVGDALYIGDGRVGSNAGEPFFEYACALMGTRKTDKFSLSIMQSCLLLTWHYLCIGRGRKGTAFASMACAGTNRVLIQLNNKPITGQGMINGVDIGEVETELLKNVNSVLSLLTLWGFMQFDTPFADFLPAVPLASESLPADRRFSKVAELDERSGNLSTRRRQAYMIKSWWALQNITSTCSHIYALYPRNAPSSEKRDDMFWVSLHRLKGINQNIPLLCLRIRKVLEEAVRSLDVRLQGDASMDAAAVTVPLVLYYVIMIHLLFPAVVEEDDWSVTVDTMSKFFETSEALMGALKRFEAESGESPGDNKWVFSRAMLPPESTDIAIANMMLLGIDACGRALEYFIGCVDKESWAESQIVLAYSIRLREVAEQLLKACKFAKLNSARRLKEVKRQIKKVLARLDEWKMFDAESPMTEPKMPQQDAFGEFDIDLAASAAAAAAFNLAGDYSNAANYDFSNLDFDTNMAQWQLSAMAATSQPGSRGEQLPSPPMSSSAQPQSRSASAGNSPEFIISAASPNIPGIASTASFPATAQASSSLSMGMSSTGSTAPSISIDPTYLDGGDIDINAGTSTATQGQMPEIKVPAPHDFQDFSFSSYNTHFPSPETFWMTRPPGVDADPKLLEQMKKRGGQ